MRAGLPLRLGQVLVPGQDLQEPQPEEHDREQRQRDARGDRHAQRQLRGQRGTAVFGVRVHRVVEERGIGPSRSDGLDSGLSPPVV